MGQLPKRYIFVDYDSLQIIKFSKLEKICNKVFIFIDPEVDSIPFALVMQAQKLGKRVKWIAAEQDELMGFDQHLSFLMGALHEKVDKNIEFAVLSDNQNFDSLVNFINDAGRNCIRVKSKGGQSLVPTDNSQDHDGIIEGEHEDDDESHLIQSLKSDI